MALAIGFAATAEVVQTGNNITVTGVGTVRADVAELQVDVRPEATEILGECEDSLDTTSLGRHVGYYEIRREAGRLVLRKRGPGFMIKLL